MKYYIDFEGWCEIEADSVKEAEAEFWRRTQCDLPFDDSSYCIDRVEVEQKDED